MTAPLPELSSALDILSAMISPAILILASGSLILTTSNRLTRVIDRVRELSMEIETLAGDTAGDQELVTEKRGFLFDLLGRAMKRARLLQRAMTWLYLALSTFVANSVTIGVLALTESSYAWIALIFVFLGAGLLLSASVFLIFESRIALASTYAEMDFLWQRGRHHVPVLPGEPSKKNWSFF